MCAKGRSDTGGADLALTVRHAQMAPGSRSSGLVRRSGKWPARTSVDRPDPHGSSLAPAAVVH
jgi:hypothetical protein